MLVRPHIGWLSSAPLGPLLACWLVAQNAPVEEVPPAAVAMPSAKQETNEPRIPPLAARATKILGAKVRNPAGEELGAIADLVVDLPNGRVTAAVISPDGLATEAELQLLPPTIFRGSPAAPVLELAPDELLEAPRFGPSAWPDLSDQTFLGSLYRSYRVEPYFSTDARQDGTTGNLELGATGNTSVDVLPPDPPPSVPAEVPLRLGPLKKARGLIGSGVTDASRENVGTVQDLIVDLPAGRVVAVVVQTGAYLGQGDVLSLVPPQSFSLPPSETELRLDLSPEALAGAPRFTGDKWRASAGEADGADELAVGQGRSPTDVATTRAIRESLIADEGLSDRAKNVVVLTKDDRVTVTGSVPDEDDKRRVIDIARSHAGPEAVEDQVVVSSE